MALILALWLPDCCPSSSLPTPVLPWPGESARSHVSRGHPAAAACYLQVRPPTSAVRTRSLTAWPLATSSVVPHLPPPNLPITNLLLHYFSFLANMSVGSQCSWARVFRSSFPQVNVHRHGLLCEDVPTCPRQTYPPRLDSHSILLHSFSCLIFSFTFVS